MMNRLSLVILIIAGLFSSCSEDFKVGANYKDITVVYGLLAKSDTAHYVRITKGFYDEKTNNLLLAQNSDSIYYNNLEVKLERLVNGNVLNTYMMDRVDANLEGFKKDSGVFVNAPNYVYKLKENLLAGSTYKIVIKNKTTGKVTYGETPIIDDNSSAFQIQSPKSLFDRLFLDKINAESSFIWSTPANASFFDVNIRFYYQEKNTITGIIDYKYKDLAIGKSILSGGGTTIAKIPNENFYRELNSNLGTPPSNITRYVDTPDVVVLAGGDVLRNYIEINAAQGGLTYDQIKPNYTNIYVDGVLGKDALGIFSTRGIKYERKVIYSNATVDSIIFGSFTKNLGFVGVSTQ